MNDQMLLDNYLLILKSTVEVYVHGTLESANELIRKTLKDSLDKTISMQQATYDEMTKRGWYTIENIDTNTIQQTINKIKNSSN